MSVNQVGTLVSFSPNTDAKSSEVNSNLSALKTAINALITATDTLAAGLTLVAKMGGSSTSNSLVTIFRNLFLALGNAAGGGDSTLDFWTLPGQAANLQSKGIRIRSWGTFAATGNTKTLRLTVAAVTLTLISTTQSGGAWFVEIMLQRGASATTYEGVAIASIGAAAPTGAVHSVQRTNTYTASWDSNQNYQFIGTGTATNDIVQRGITIEYLGT